VTQSCSYSFKTSEIDKYYLFSKVPEVTLEGDCSEHSLPVVIVDENGKFSEVAKFTFCCLIAASVQIFLLDI